MAIYQIEIRSAAMPGQEEAYEEWYNGTHLGEVLEVDGFLSGQQFRLPEVSEAGHTHAAYSGWRRMTQLLLLPRWGKLLPVVP